MSAADSASYALAGFAVIGGIAATGLDIRRRRRAPAPTVAPPALTSHETVSVRPVAVTQTVAPGGAVVWRLSSELDEPIVVDVFSYRSATASSPTWHHELMEKPIDLPARHRHFWPVDPLYDRTTVLIGWTRRSGTTHSGLVTVDRPPPIT